MDILIVMMIGVVIGAKIFPKKFKRQNEIGQMVCTILLIFAMGLMLGNRDDLMSQLSSIGLVSLVLALGGILGSVAIVYLLTEWLMKPKKRRRE